MTDYMKISFPPYFSVETIRACNSRCVFCPYSTGKLRGREIMPQEIYNKVEAELIEHKHEVNRVTLCLYGEPLLDPYIVNRVRKLKEGGIHEVALTTNASLLNGKMGEELLHAGLDIIRLSINSVVPDKYGQLQVGLDFNAVMTNANEYFHSRDSINPNSKIYVSMVDMPPLSCDDIDVWKNHWRPLLQENDQLKIAKYFDLLVEDRQDLGGDRVRSPCFPKLQSMEIIYSGDVPMCCADYFGPSSRYIIGNVKENTLEEIWNCEQSRHYRNMQICGRRNEIELCRGCDMWDEDVREDIIA